MQYYEKVIAHAEHVQVYLGEDIELIKKLDEKVASIEVGTNRHKYWNEVRGRIFRNSHYSESYLVTHLENKFSGEPNEVQDVASILNSPQLLQWIGLLDLFNDGIIDTLDYHIDHDVMGRYNEEDADRQSLNVLRFYNNALKEGKTVTQLFPYLPLLRWSIEGLVANKRLSSKFHSFLKQSVIPIARAQRRITLIFLELMEEEEEHIAAGVSPDSIVLEIEEANTANQLSLEKELASKADDATSEEKVNAVALAKVFNRKYEPPEEVQVKVPPVPSEGEDVYLCVFSKLINNIIEDDETKIKQIITILGKHWNRYPLTYIHRIVMAKERLGVDDGYIIPISPKLLISVYKMLQAHFKTYSQERLLRNLRNMMEVVLDESRDADQEKMFFLAATYNIEREKYYGLLDEMQMKGLASPISIFREKEWLHREGKHAGFYHA